MVVLFLLLYIICALVPTEGTQTFQLSRFGQSTHSLTIDLVTVFDAILTSRQTREKLQCLYENLMSNNFRKMAVLNKISIIIVN